MVANLGSVINACCFDQRFYRGRWINLDTKRPVLYTSQLNLVIEVLEMSCDSQSLNCTVTYIMQDEYNSDYGGIVHPDILEGAEWRRR